MTKMLVLDRQQGKTTWAIRWLMDGHKVEGWPGWSRILIVMTATEARRVLTDYPDEQAKLHAMGNGGLGKLVITLDEARHALSVADPEVEVAFDNADLLVERALRRRPEFVTYDGEMA